MLNGSVNPNNSSTSVTFEFGVGNGPLTQTVPATPITINGATVQPVSATLNSLLPNQLYSYRARAVNNGGVALGATLQFTTAPAITTQSPAITTQAVLVATQGVAYSYDVDATGVPAPVFVLSTAPAGMTISTTSGVIQWTPTQLPGQYPVVVRASNGVPPNATQAFTITLAAAPNAQAVSPVVECVVDRGSSTIPRYIARFGYNNPNTFVA